MGDFIALVNQDDVITGYADKMDVHAKGLLHRAFSIIIFNSKQQILIHRRANNKYHSPGLWTNACCSHLPKGAAMGSAVYDRLKHEMGIFCDLNYVLTFCYQVTLDYGLVENEIDHVYIGVFDGEPNPNPKEVSEWRWVDIDDLLSSIHVHPDSYTYWFKHIVLTHGDVILEHLQRLKQR